MKRILFELSELVVRRTADGQADAGEGKRSGEGEASFSALSDGRFRKEVIREGTWVHPTRNFRLAVTRDRMQRWVEKFRLMRKRGIRVPVPFGHSYDPKDNAGFVEDLELDGNVLVAVLSIPRDEDARKMGTTVRDVSISVNPDFRDGQGRRYGEVIEHVALTTRPVVPGQGDFVPLSLPDGGQAELWRFEVEDLRPRRLAGDSQVPAARSAEDASDVEAEASDDARDDPSAQGDKERPESSSAVEADMEPVALAADHQPPNPPAEPGPEAEPADTARELAEDGEAAALARRLDDLQRASLDRELDDLLRCGRLTPAMREPARRLLALDEPVAVQFADGPGQVDVAAELRALLEAVPEHALIDLGERTLFVASEPVGEMTDERAAKLAEENRRLAKLEA